MVNAQSRSWVFMPFLESAHPSQGPLTAATLGALESAATGAVQRGTYSRQRSHLRRRGTGDSVCAQEPAKRGERTRGVLHFVHRWTEGPKCVSTAADPVRMPWSLCPTVAASGRLAQSGLPLGRSLRQAFGRASRIDAIAVCNHRIYVLGQIRVPDSCRDATRRVLGSHLGRHQHWRQTRCSADERFSRKGRDYAQTPEIHAPRSRYITESDMIWRRVVPCRSRPRASPLCKQRGSQSASCPECLIQFT